MVLKHAFIGAHRSPRGHRHADAMPPANRAKRRVARHSASRRRHHRRGLRSRRHKWGGHVPNIRGQKIITSARPRQCREVVEMRERQLISIEMPQQHADARHGRAREHAFHVEGAAAERIVVMVRLRRLFAWR